MSLNGEMSHAHQTRVNEVAFHAVYVPQENADSSPKNNSNDNVRVYLDKTEALKVIKEYKTGRLKTFKKRSDAEQYARTGSELTINCISSPPPIPTIVAEEKPSTFKAPRPQDLVCFRKLIENSDVDTVRNVIWGNPRYLISSGDTPAILKEGCRYNALHIAVIACRADMCELILNTVGDTSFIQLLYGEEEQKNYLDRAQIMLDLYLNTPDKGLNETPLHFAVKFGLKDVVRILVSYSQCIKTLPNKYKDLPIDIICSRKCQNDTALKKEIRMLLEDQYYVPVLRSEDHTLQPIIGEPFSPVKPPNLNADPISPRVEVRAFAGPMTKSQATEFRKKWKTPPRTRITPTKKDVQESNGTNCHNVNLALRLQDTEKGLERVGRDLAEEYRVQWKEHWSFLDDYADFRCTEGLTKLEKYLEKKLKKSLLYRRQAESQRRLDELCDQLKSSLSIYDCEKTENGTEDGNEEFSTPPSSPIFTRDDSDDEMYEAEEGPTIFIEGSSVSKVDYDVYNAVPPSISSYTYPHIYFWRHGVQLALKDSTFRLYNSTIARRKLLPDLHVSTP